MDKAEVMRLALATFAINQGEFLPADCPENPARQWPEGSANHAVYKLIQEALPKLEEALGDYAYERAVPRAQALLEAILKLNYKPLTNYAVEKFKDASMTPNQQIHYVEERYKSVTEKLQGSGESSV